VSECVLYKGYLNKDGYGVMFFWNAETKRSTQKRAHRIAWENEYGEIPKGVSVCHKCDVRNCVNVKHLFLGTQMDNMKDKTAKGRQAKGAEHSRKIKSKVPHIPQKLTWETVTMIRDWARSYTQRELAFMFNISQIMVWKIINNKSWVKADTLNNAGYQK